NQLLSPASGCVSERDEERGLGIKLAIRLVLLQVSFLSLRAQRGNLSFEIASSTLWSLPQGSFIDFFLFLFAPKCAIFLP
ncbi:MAG: hypothetical protein Q8N12_08405, partial [Thermodesulfovibrionales bacterium]|nr:hypothetical protein [Thermodesulfovibrionales bacterium]